MPAAYWADAKKVVVTYRTQTAVRTHKRDWERGVLNAAVKVLGSLASILTLNLISPIPGPQPGVPETYAATIERGAAAARAGVGGGAAVARAGAARKDDSVQASHEIQKHIGDWRVADVLVPRLQRALEARTRIPVEVRPSDGELDLGMDLAKPPGEAAKELVDGAERHLAAKPDPGVKTFPVRVSVTYAGGAEPQLSCTFAWHPRSCIDEMMADAIAEHMGKRRGGSFIIHDDREKAMARYRKAHRHHHEYSCTSKPHAREEWLRDGCALLKREVERGLDELCAKMAKDMFPEARGPAAK
jgi:hypothetical protein